MEDFDFLEETTFEDEFDVDPQDDWEYYLDERDDYGRYVNKYGDINYVRQNMPPMRNNASYFAEFDQYDDIEIENFYKTQKARLWNGDYMTIYESKRAEFYLDKKTGQLYAFTENKKARLTDPKNSNIYLPLKSIAIQAGVEFVRDNLGFKDFAAYYDESGSRVFKKSFYHALVERGWLEQSPYSDYISFGLPFSKYVHFIYKKYSSNTNDFGVIAKFRSKEVELTYRGTTHDFLSLDKIAKKFGKGSDAFVRQILGVKNYKSRAIILNQDTPLFAEEFDIEKQSLENTSHATILNQDTSLLAEDIERQSLSKTFD